MQKNKESVIAEILTIGDEILFGQIVDTNSAFIGAQLSDAGIRPVHKTSVGDHAEAILAALAAAKARANIVLITGGLGPTKDDITKKTLANFFGCGMLRHPEAFAALERLFAARGRVLNELNQQQAEMPDCAEYVINEKGTAPGMWFDVDDTVYVSMPGVPGEMRHMLVEHVLPKLKQRFVTPTILHRYIQTSGVPESDLAIKLEAWEDALPAHVKLAYLPARGRVKLRLTGTGTDKHLLEQELDSLVQQALPIVGKNVFSLADEDLPTVLAKRLREANKTLSCMESCTGGAFATAVTTNAGASKYFIGGTVAYSVDIKQKMGVPAEVIDNHGVVSAEVAIAMAEAARNYFGSDLALSSTGIAGPPNDGDEAPAGTIYIACAMHGRTEMRPLKLFTDRAINIELTVNAMLDLARQCLED